MQIMDTETVINSQASYQRKRQTLITQMVQLTQQNIPIRLYKQTSNLFRHRQTTTKQAIDVRPFNQVIHIDQKNLCADVEAMTTYEVLVNECLKYHCLPTVVPELKSITVGGALTGGGIESSSFRYGLAHETMLGYEVILSNGKVVDCQPDNDHRDLFYGLPNSYGTLGYALRLQVKLRAVKPFVRLTHLRFSEPDKYFEKLAELCLNNRNQEVIGFIDGVIFKKDEMYITIGEFVDHAPYLSNYTFRQIYYRSIQHRKEDYLTTLDYIWRWDTDWFWCSKFFYLQNSLLRRLVGKKRLNSATYWRWRHFFSSNPIAKRFSNLLSGKTESVIQDVQIPIAKAVDFVNFFHKNIGITPIWVCPTMPFQRDVIYDFYPMSPDILYVNFGFWDVVPTQHEEGYYNRLIEEKVGQLQGKKSLYSDLYYSEEEFWSIFNKDVYDRLKQQYDPQQCFQSLYQKCVEK